jgi:hypothetical protein
MALNYMGPLLRIKTSFPFNVDSSLRTNTSAFELLEKSFLLYPLRLHLLDVLLAEQSARHMLVLRLKVAFV